MRISEGLLMIMVLPLVTGQKVKQTPCDPANPYDGWILGPDQKSCYQLTNRKYHFKAAEKYCQSEGGHLASIHSDEEHEFLRVFDGYSLGSGPFWIGFTNVFTNDFNWTDQSPVDYKNFHNTSQLNYSCVNAYGSFPSGKWNSQSCLTKSDGVCKKSAVKPTKKAQIVTCDDGWKLGPNKKYCYALTKTRSNFDAAEQECKTNRGNLASIHSDKERNFTKQFHGDYYSLTWNLWIGLNRQHTKEFSWTDESPVDKTYWSGRRPSNNVNAKCVKAWGLGKKGEENKHSYRWVDTQCYVQTFYGLCKKPATVKQGE